MDRPDNPSVPVTGLMLFIIINDMQEDLFVTFYICLFLRAGHCLSRTNAVLAPRSQKHIPLWLCETCVPACQRHSVK